MSKKFKVGDKVRRKGISSPVGVVTKVRKEIVRTQLKQTKDDVEPPGITVSVRWDNGTTSHFVPEGLQVAK